MYQRSSDPVTGRVLVVAVVVCVGVECWGVFVGRLFVRTSFFIFTRYRCTAVSSKALMFSAGTSLRCCVSVDAYSCVRISEGSLGHVTVYSGSINHSI